MKRLLYTFAAAASFLLLLCCLALWLWTGWPGWLAVAAAAGVVPVRWFLSRASQVIQTDYCMKCGYDLRHIKTRRCPECGKFVPWLPLLNRKKVKFYR